MSCMELKHVLFDILQCHFHWHCWWLKSCIDGWNTFFPLKFWLTFPGVHLLKKIHVACGNGRVYVHTQSKDSSPGKGHIGKLTIEFSEIRGSCEWTKIPSKSNWHKVIPVGVLNHFGIFRPLDQQRALIEQTTQLNNTLKKLSPFNSPMIKHFTIPRCLSEPNQKPTPKTLTFHVWVHQDAELAFSLQP